MYGILHSLSMSPFLNTHLIGEIAQILGCVVFLAVAGRIFYSTSINTLRPLLPAGTPVGFIAELIAGASSSAFESLSEEVSEMVIKGITHSMRNVWIFLLSAGCLSFILTLFLSVRNPSKPKV